MDNKLFREITCCRICGNNGLTIVLDLGDQPPANSLRDNIEEKLPRIPLQLVCCRLCGAAQLSVSVNPEYLFKHYVWVTGTAETTRNYSKVFCDRMLDRLPKKNLKIIEIASNDGTFLKPFKSCGHEVLGIDPAENIAETANSEGINTLADFFGIETASKVILEFGMANCVFARNVVPHVENIHDVIEGMGKCLAEGGLGAIEFHYAGTIQFELHYDSIYHEHNLYLSLKCLSGLLLRHGFYPYDLTESPISGGSLVVYFSNKKNKQTVAFTQTMENESRIRLNSIGAWKNFAEQSHKHKKSLINAVKSSPSKIIGYGASARSSTMLNFCGIGNKHIECIADKNPIKHNKYTPGTDIKIVPPDMAMQSKPESILLLAWNFRDEIIDEMKNKYGFSGNVIIPFPGKVKVVEV
jgi:hypothetical protein